MPNSGRDLIFEALGPRRPDETLEAYLHRGSPKVGIGVPSLLKFWKGQYGSKKTVSKLQEKKATNNADNLAAKYEALASAIENAGGLRAEVDEIRDLARRFGRIHRRAGPLGDGEI